jgi:hypothetical protein
MRCCNHLSRSSFFIGDFLGVKHGTNHFCVFFVSVTMDSNLTAGVLPLSSAPDAFYFLLKIMG